MDYVRSYRLGRARELLAGGEMSMTGIAQACGLGTGSYFAKLFREETGLSPLDYRKQSKGDKAK